MQSIVASPCAVDAQLGVNLVDDRDAVRAQVAKWAADKDQSSPQVETTPVPLKELRGEKLKKSCKRYGVFIQVDEVNNRWMRVGLVYKSKARATARAIWINETYFGETFLREPGGEPSRFLNDKGSQRCIVLPVARRPKFDIYEIHLDSQKVWSLGKHYKAGAAINQISETFAKCREFGDGTRGILLLNAAPGGAESDEEESEVSE